MMLYKKSGLVLGRDFASGPLGGDQAIGVLVSADNVCGIIFFRDPLSAYPHRADIEAWASFVMFVKFHLLLILVPQRQSLVI